MPDADIHLIQAQVVELRADFHGLKEDAAQQREAIKSIADKLDNLMKSVADSRRTDWPRVIGFFGLIITITGMLIAGGWFMVRLQLMEIETQFMAYENIHNMHFAESERKYALLWNSVHPSTPYPESPYYFPSIRNN